MASHVKNIVLFDANPKAEDLRAAESHGLKVITYEHVMETGKNTPGELEGIYNSVKDSIFGSSKPKPCEKNDTF